MYAYIKGVIEDVENDKIIIETNDIGYNVFVPSNVLMNIGFKGNSVKIYTYTHVKEDAMTLFGFLTKDDLQLFKLLITVNGIGPKGAMAILSTLSSEDLRFAIMSGDSKAIANSPGIGAKTAQKVILELKDKLKLTDISNTEITGFINTGSKDENDIVTDAAMALVSLGYGQTEALKAIRECDIDSISGVEELIKEALKKMI